MGELTWYSGCAFKRDRVRGVIRDLPIAFVDKIIDDFNVTAVSPIPALPDKLRPKQPGEPGVMVAVQGSRWELNVAIQHDLARHC